ncbi:MAG: type III pantothenate kinase [Myxococcota bacterium]
MLLALDLGNTNLTLGLYEDDHLSDSWRLQTVHSRTEDEYALLVHQLFDLGGYRADAVEGVILASVVPVLTPTIVALCRRLFDLNPVVVGPGVKTGVSVRYDPPKDVGADRIVNAVAAYTRFESACIVVDFGTATTFDSVQADGTYAGGAIAPGIQLSMSALFSRAAKLPKVDLDRPPKVVGRTTVESIQSGVYFGYVALVDGLVTRMRDEMGLPRARVLATGGLAPILAEDSSTIEVVDEYLTLEGLRLIYRLNVS